MKIVAKLPVLLLVLTASPALHVFGGDFQPYPGSTLDQKATEEANKTLPRGESTCELSVYLTSEAYDTVVQFYKDLGTEHPIFSNVPTFKGLLPGGAELRKTAVILDGAQEVGDSSLWVQIQHPFILDVKMEGHTPKFLDVRDLTGVTLIAGQCKG